jgi:cytochrome c-type biogenesis protein CcmH
MAERSRALLVVAFVAAMLPGSVGAAGAIDAFEFEDPAQAVRYQSLIDELRCPKCLNTNLSGSDAPIAADLRALVYRKVRDGETDAAIRDYLQTRYGDFVLYDPPKRADTLVLWVLPVLLLIVGLAVIGRIARRRAAAAPPVLGAEDADRLAHLLEEVRSAEARTSPSDEREVP